MDIQKGTRSNKYTDFRPSKPMYLKPIIKEEKTVAGTRFYIDDKGKMHDADRVDLMFGVVKQKVSTWRFKGVNPNHRKLLK